ncbi:Armadillo [Macleaya cordata]|uniref:RING-type E3 ubiquitin transferase n=1 Tax=Macleaya cordata TaxID=56857 RepID=A0A200QGD3_MACCD|nr:Armadillo [Macleaya cordata]
MDVAEVEESVFAASDAKLHGGICRILSAIISKILGIFPVLEASRPRSKSGIEALCSLHVALEKAKNLLQHCSDCSKLYLAITGDSVLLKFEKSRCALRDSLRRVEDIVPQAIGCQILAIVNELEETVFSLDLSEKQVGDEVIVLLQHNRKFNRNSNDNNELETFHQAASRLGITSSRAAVAERRALKKLIERARIEEDKRKESIVAYLLHLMRKYSKLFRNEFFDDNDSQGSAPCSPTVQGSFDECGVPGENGQAFDRQFSKLSSFNFRPIDSRSEQMPVPPEELRCPISLQLMYDPVIISSGQTYERVCIEKWFNEGHNTCPKTQQQLPHICLTPNYCVKGLISSWCEHNGVPVPDGPPDSLNLKYWRLALSESESTDSRSMESISSCKGVKVVPLEEKDMLEELEGNGMRSAMGEEADNFERYNSLLTILCDGEDLSRQCKVVEQIRLFLKVDEEARMFMGANGFVEALVNFLSLAVHSGNVKAQEIGAMALFNLAVNNNRNKMMMLSAGVIPVVEEMILNSNCYESATALYLNLSCLEEAKPLLSQAVPFLVQLLSANCESQCKLDALHTLYNLSTHSPNIPSLLAAGILEGLQALLTNPADGEWVEKSIVLIINLASNQLGKEEITSAPGLISALAAILDMGELVQQEQAVSCLLVLCNGSEKCSEMVLQEGVIPALVSISVTGTTRGKDKAERLLMLFRELRQRDASSDVDMQEQAEGGSMAGAPAPEPKPPCKSTSRKMGRALSSIWRNKQFSVYQC